jgi:predicted component of type VI protein secretion system
MQSSFESEAAFGLPPSSVVSPNSVTGPLSPGPGALQLTSIQEYNLQQLANLAEKAEREQQAVAAAMSQSPPLPPPSVSATTPSSNSSPTPSFSLADLFSGDHAINNLQALAKLGSASLNNHGKSKQAKL